MSNRTERTVCGERTKCGSPGGPEGARGTARSAFDGLHVVTGPKGQSLSCPDHRPSPVPRAPGRSGEPPDVRAARGLPGGPGGTRAAPKGWTWGRSQGREALVRGNLDTRIGYFTSGETDASVGVTAERSLLAALGAGCSAPAGTLSGLVADEQYSELRPRGAVGSTDDASLMQMSITGSAPASDDDACPLGRALAGPVLAKDAAGPMGERTP